MKWKHPPIIKIYEALGSVADGRVEISENKANTANTESTSKVYSSTRNKFYDVVYNSEKKQIMTNDNGSYWKGYLGYPAIAYLMVAKVLSYDDKVGNLLRGIAWKDINQKFHNDFDKTLQFILSSRTKDEIDRIKEFVMKVDQEINNLQLGLLGKKTLPPDGY